ncbi:MAG: hypothetical protein ACRDSJ_09170 [Rubrobacteraceae bacterium]
MKFPRALLNWSFLLCIPAGVLWALSPLGVYLSDYAFKTPNVFWKLFPSAPLLMLAGLAGVYFFHARERDLLSALGFWTVAAGALLVIAGDVGKYYLAIDEVFIMSVPAYTAMRVGFVVLAIGSIVFGVGVSRSLPVWGTLPFAIASLAGLISVWRDFGEFGAAMWIAFGIGWSWLGLALCVEKVAVYSKKRRASKTSMTSI